VSACRRLNRERSKGRAGLAEGDRGDRWMNSELNAGFRIEESSFSDLPTV
jgi:hypothetical protein